MSSHWNSPNSASSEENSWRARTFFCSLIVGPTIYFRKRASSSQRYSEFTRPHFRAFSDIAPHGDNDDDDDVDDRPHQTRPAQRWKLNQEGRNERRREEGQKWERENGEKDRKTERETQTKRSSFDERGASVRSRCGEKKTKIVFFYVLSFSSFKLFSSSAALSDWKVAWSTPN